MVYEKIKKYLPYITSVLVVITGIAFIVSAICICSLGGDRPYSREVVGEYLKYLSIPSVITLISIILGVIFPLAGKKVDGVYNPWGKKIILGRLAARLDREKCDSEARERIDAEKRTRKVYTVVLLAIVLACSAASVIYLVAIAEFTKENLNSDIVSALMVVLPTMAVALGCGIIALYRFDVSYSREIELTKALIAGGAVRTEPEAAAASRLTLWYRKNDKRILFGARAIVLTLSVTFVILGVINGGMADVLGKAIRICTECIGLG